MHKRKINKNNKWCKEKYPFKKISLTLLYESEYIIRYTQKRASIGGGGICLFCFF